MTDELYQFGQGSLYPFDWVEELRNEKLSVAKKVGIAVSGLFVVVLTVIGGIFSGRYLKGKYLSWKQKKGGN